MQAYEYRVIPAPRRGEKAKGARSTPERFGVALTHLMNDLAAGGWEYLRADTLPCDERQGLTGTATHYHAMLVFRRPLPAAQDAEVPARHGPPLAAPVLNGTTPSMDDLIPEAIEPDERTLLAPVAHPPAGQAPALGPADGAAWRPNGRGP